MLEIGKVAVFGLGKAGVSAVDFLVDAGADVYVWDDSDEQRNKISKATITEVENWPWDELEYLVLSPGIPYSHNPHAVVELAQSKGCKIICDIELLYLSSPESIFVGITGTNGKSTTTALVQHVAKHAGLNSLEGGNIGIAASSLPALGKDGVYILEMSSYQLDLLDKTKFNIAALLNITPDHIDRHGDMGGYVNAKKNIFNGQGEGDTAIIALGDEYTKAIFNELQSSDINIVSAETAKIENLKTLPGEHNKQNIAVAYAILHALGIKDGVIKEGIKSFPGLAHRLQYVREVNGVTFVNDSKATNAIAASNALKSFKDIYWIAGGVEKEGGIRSLEPLFPHVKHVFLIGEAQESFAKQVEEKIEYSKNNTLDNAFNEAVNMADSGATILLSPACASFDQFKNFEERGDAFCKMVDEL